VRFLLRVVVLLGISGGFDGMRAGGCSAFSADCFENRQNVDHALDSRSRFRRLMPATIRADHPAILPVAAAIRAVTTNPLEQLVMVNDVTHLLVDFDEDERVYGRPEFHATLDEMIARRREAGWVYLRDDCDGRAVFAAHLLASLGIQWRLEASYWQRHAWVVARVGDIEYDLLELRGATPETKEFTYRVIGHYFVRAAHPPPYFRWRQAWRERTHGDVEIAKCLGLLELDSTPSHWRERVAVDWTKVHPQGQMSPVDPRMLAASTAAFPYGEALHPLSFAQSAPRMATSEVGTRILLGAASEGATER
jgi:hypothetical protein